MGRSRRWSFLLQDLGLSLVQAGWLVSLTEAGGAGLGLAAGLVIARLGSRRALTIGLVLLAAASLGEGLAPGRGAVCGALGREPRLSFHCHCRTEPRRCAREPGTAGRGTGAAERLRPAGLAIGAALTGAATALFSWQGVMLGWAAAAMIALSASYLLRRDVGRHASGYIMPSGSVWLLAAGFGCYTAVEVGFLALLPAYLTEQKACSPNSVLRARSPGRLSSATSQAAGAGPRSHKRPSSPRSSHLG